MIMHWGTGRLRSQGDKEEFTNETEEKKPIVEEKTQKSLLTRN